MPDFRSLISRMADELDHYRQLLMDDRRETHALAVEARAALAEPEPEWPTDEELEQWYRDCADKTTLGAADHYWAFEVPVDYANDLARAVLARWGRPTPQPADGEVAELVADLRGTAAGLESQAYPQTAAQITRAADLLERLSPPQPVPVSERLPGPGDWVWHCYAGVRFWQHGIYNGRQFFVGDGPESQPATHWLPAHALPLPTTTSASD